MTDSTASASPWPQRVKWLLLATLVALGAILVLGPDPFGAAFFARREAGEHLRPRDYAFAYLWWMSLASAVSIVGLLATFSKWARPGRGAEDPAFESHTPATPAFFIVVALAMLGLVISALPRLDDSLWTDEKYMVVRSIAGQYGVEDSGEVEFDRVSWGNTLFYYVKPNNHVPYSIAARLTWDAVRTVTQPEDQRASETVVRLPALAAGVAGLGTLAWLLLRLGFPVAGMWAACILALHPWYLRYASEVRGYSLMLALVPLYLVSAMRVLERGSWPRWACFGAIQFLLLWTYPGTLFVLIAVNGAVLFRLWSQREADAGEGAPPLLRFLLTGFLSGLLWLQLNLVNMMQFLDYAKNWTRPISSRFLAETGLLMLFGTETESFKEGFVSMESVSMDYPILLPCMVFVSCLAFLAGAVRLAWEDAPSRLAWIGLLLPGPMTVVFAAVRGDHLYEWYLIHALPGIIGCLAIGLVLLARLFPLGRARSVALTLVGLVFFASYAAITDPMRTALRTRDIEPTFLLLEAFGWPPHRDPSAERPALTGQVYGPTRYYDPRALDLRDPSLLRAAMVEADRQELPFFVSFDRPKLARKRRPETIAVLERPELFEPVGQFDGVFHKYRRVVYRYVPGSVEDFRLEETPASP